MPAGHKVAIVTGASQGIGAAIADAYQARGWRVVATSRSITPADTPDRVTVAGDIADPGTGERLVRTALERFGRLDTLVNNAGIFIGRRFTDYTDEQYHRMLATNLNGFFFTTRHAVRAMLDQDSGGHIVQVTTILAERAYSANPSVLAALTKGGLVAATRSLAIEYAPHNIRANAVSPGVIRTPMHPPDTHASLAGLHPLGRMGEVSDIAQAVLYLEDASFVTGEILHVDGGQVAGH